MDFTDFRSDIIKALKVLHITKASGGLEGCYQVCPAALENAHWKTKFFGQTDKGLQTGRLSQERFDKTMAMLAELIQQAACLECLMSKHWGKLEHQSTASMGHA